MKRISVLLVVIWMIVIFIFSNYNGEVSTMQSEGLLDKILMLIHYTGDVDILRYLIRKCAHITEYLILGILVYNACKYNSIKDIIKLSIIICILYACSDEIHQLFVNDRSGQIYDVLIDSVGSSLGVFLMHKIRK